MKNTYVVIMAGGRGERFWPLSTGSVPKPFMKLMGDKTLIQLTVERAKKIVPVTRIFVVLGRQHLTVAKRQLPGLPHDNFIIEPEGRDTAPCIGLAAVTLLNRDRNATMVVLPADHFVPDTRGFAETIKDGVKVAKGGYYHVTIGVRPVWPETGYGYICCGESHSLAGCAPFFRVERYVEKPDMKRAKVYCNDSRYYWNAGIFIWRVTTLMVALEEHMPSLHEGLLRIRSCLAEKRHAEADRIFKGFTRISIDYGLMEKVRNVVMIPARFLWDDIGTWASLLRTGSLDEHGNYRNGDIISIDTKGCVIQSDTMTIGTIGVSDLVIVATDKGILVCDVKRVQEVREMAKRLTTTTRKAGSRK